MDARRVTTGQDVERCAQLLEAHGVEAGGLRAGGGAGYWLLEHDGEVVACGGLRQGGEADELVDGVVGERWRGQGLGRYLLMLRLREAKSGSVRAWVPLAVLGFYEKQGFRVESKADSVVYVVRRLAVCS